MIGDIPPACAYLGKGAILGRKRGAVGMRDAPVQRVGALAEQVGDRHAHHFGAGVIGEDNHPPGVEHHQPGRGGTDDPLQKGAFACQLLGCGFPQQDRTDDIGEGLQQIDLLGQEIAAARNRIEADKTEKRPLFDHRHQQQRPDLLRFQHLMLGRAGRESVDIGDQQDTIRHQRVQQAREILGRQVL